MSKINVEIDGALVPCRVTERLGYTHDVDTYVAEVEHNGEKFIVLKYGKTWRRRTPRERVQPLLDHIAREKAAGRKWPA